MKNFLLCTVLPPGASKVDQTRKFDDFLNLTQLFSMIPYSISLQNDITILFKMTFLTTFIPIIKLYDLIIKLFNILGEIKKKILVFLIYYVIFAKFT